MASAWGSSWSTFWGNSWGALESAGSSPSQEVVLRKLALKRGKKYLIFDTQEEIDEFLAAEQAANDAIEKAKEASRQTKRRLKKRVYEAVAHKTVDVDQLGILAKRYAVSADIPALIAKQDYLELVALSLLVQQLMDEEEAEFLLLT